MTHSTGGAARMTDLDHPPSIITMEWVDVRWMFIYVCHARNTTEMTVSIAVSRCSVARQAHDDVQPIWCAATLQPIEQPAQKLCRSVRHCEVHLVT
jgi:hypothetical protein